MRFPDGALEVSDGALSLSNGSSGIPKASPGRAGEPSGDSSGPPEISKVPSDTSNGPSEVFNAPSEHSGGSPERFNGRPEGRTLSKACQPSPPRYQSPSALQSQHQPHTLFNALQQRFGQLAKRLAPPPAYRKTRPSQAHGSSSVRPSVPPSRRPVPRTALPREAPSPGASRPFVGSLGWPSETSDRRSKGSDAPAEVSDEPAQTSDGLSKLWMDRQSFR
jgi:hypothetical protein